MGKSESFEELLAWQKARSLANRIYEITRLEEFSRDWGLKDQIRRAAVSVMSNVAEGYERGNPKEFSYFLSIAKGSCGEVRSQLYIAFDAAYIDEETLLELKELATQTSKIIYGLRAYQQSRLSK